MDALVRRRRALLIGVVLAACGGARGGPVGTSDKVAARSGVRDAGEASVVDGAESLPANYRSTFVKVNKARLVSQGHAGGGRWDIDVWANELAQKALAARSREVPVGALVVAEHFERPKSEPGPVMVMEKKAPGFSGEHGDWRYATIGARGQLVRDGVVDSCAGCHDASPMDGLFPIVE